MKRTLQVIGFILILIGGFWLGVQWGNSVRPVVPAEETKPTTIVPVIVPAENMPTNSAAEEKPEDSTVATPTPEVVVPAPATIIDPDLPKKISDTLSHYQSGRYHFSIDVPSNLYYSAFSGEGEALSTFGVAKVNPDTLADAAIRIYYYGKKVVPELQGVAGGKFTDPSGKFVYLLINNEYSFKIEALNINHPIVQKIIPTITAGN